jgi:Tfp pilus assembly protein FimV
MFERSLDTEQTFAHPEGMHRTYVRRRRTAAVLTIAVVAVLLSPLAAGAVRHGSSVSPSPSAQVVVVVRPGDTLWSIARRVRPAADPRASVASIMDINAVDAGSLTPGQALIVPLG